MYVLSLNVDRMVVEILALTLENGPAVDINPELYTISVSGTYGILGRS